MLHFRYDSVAEWRRGSVLTRRALFATQSARRGQVLERLRAGYQARGVRGDGGDQGRDGRAALDGADVAGARTVTSRVGGGFEAEVLTRHVISSSPRCGSIHCCRRSSSHRLTPRDTTCHGHDTHLAPRDTSSSRRHSRPLTSEDRRLRMDPNHWDTQPLVVAGRLGVRIPPLNNYE